MDNARFFGEWLKWERKRRRWTQHELATMVNYQKDMIRKIETDERRFARLQAEQLVKVLDIPPEEREAVIAWARGGDPPDYLSLSERAGGAADAPLFVPGQVIRLKEPVEGQREWMLVPAPPCVEKACNGQDPEVTGCAKESITAEGPEIMDAAGTVVGIVELRFSRACQTNWARVTRLVGENRHLRAYLRNEEGQIIRATRSEAEASQVYVYGPMWYAPTGEVQVKACGGIEGCDEVCTNLH